MTLDPVLADDLEAVIGRLQADLLEDRAQVTPQAAAAPDPGDVVFFARDMWEQVLTDLAYVPAPDAPFYPALGAFVAEARLDLAMAPFAAALDALAAIVAHRRAQSRDDLFAVDALLEVLASVLSFETRNGAEHFTARCPDLGEVSVWSRIVQARLDRLGLLMHTGVGHPWGEEDALALLRLHRLLRHPDAPLSAFGLSDAERHACIALSGDADALIARLRARDPGGFLVAASSAFPGRRDAFYDRLRVRTDGFFSSAPLVSFAPALRRIGAGIGVRHEIAEPVHADAQSALRDGSNVLGLRLVQIKLWQSGYYEDSIDAVVGPNTISALLEALEIYGQQTISEVLPDVMRRLGDGRIAISLHGLHALVFSAETVEEMTPDMAEAAARAAESITLRRAPAETDQIHAPGPAPALRPDARDPERGFLGRVRRGVARVFKTTGRVLRSAFSVIRRGVVGMAVVVDRMLSPLRDLLGLAFEELDKVRYLLGWVLRTWQVFLLGKPLAIGRPGEGFATVRFSLDRDARLLLINTPSDAVLDAFRNATRRLFRLMGLTFKALATILKVIVSLATWPGRVRLVFEVLGLIQGWVRTGVGGLSRDAALA